MNTITFSYKNSLIPEEDIINESKKLDSYRVHLSSIAQKGTYNDPESSINLPADNDLLDISIKTLNRLYSKNTEHFISVGIGGSNLGTIAILDALRGVLSLEKLDTKIYFADTIDSHNLKSILDTVKNNSVNPENIIINVVSKSGTTTETISNFEVIYKELSKHFGEKISNRVVFTTDDNSRLWKLAKEKGMFTLPIPKEVGGRYSVFSPVGIFPLASIGIDVKKLLNGAQAMRNECLYECVSDNPAMTSAILMFLHNKKGINISNNFFFNSELENLGKWYRQLMGESIGKKYGENGVEIHSGITPIVSIGSKDLHSMAQLYLGGPKDKFTTFIYSKKGSGDLTLPSELLFPDLVSGISDKKFSEIMEAILVGVKRAYKKNNIPFMEINLPELSENSIGQFMQFKMMEIMYLAKLLGINAFNQPNVEDYKRETRQLLM